MNPRIHLEGAHHLDSLIKGEADARRDLGDPPSRGLLETYRSAWESAWKVCKAGDQRKPAPDCLKIVVAVVDELFPPPKPQPKKRRRPAAS